MDVILIGAGGHAKVVVEILMSRGDRIVAYVDPKPSNWLAVERFENSEIFDDRSMQVVMGLGAVKPERLRHRLGLLDDWIDRGFAAPVVVHPSAVVSKSARLKPGAMVLAQAVVQPGAVIGRGVIVNTGAIVEHDSILDAGVHVAPGAVILGEVQVGACAMIGAGAVVLPGAEVAAEALIKAHSRYGMSAQ